MINRIKFAVCDDEPQMVREVEGLLADYLKERREISYSIRPFDSGRSLLESGGGFDVIFLDIQMEPPDGMETARILRQRGDRSLLVFITVLKECVFDAFSVEAWDYLLKPLDSVQFRRTMDRAVKFLERRTAKSLLIQRGTVCEVLPLAEIVYCEVQGRKIYLHKRDGTVTGYYEKLESLECQIGGHFFKCHRSYLVNLDYVRGCQGGQVLLSQGEAIPVSRLREQDLTRALLRYMKEKDF